MILDNFDSHLIDEILTLEKNDKAIILICYIERQIKLVEDFDKKYNLEYALKFREFIDLGIRYIITDKISTNFSKLYNVESYIIDSEEYSDISGTFSQNAFISLKYYFDFMLTDSNESLLYGFEKIFESQDLVFYKEDPNYDFKIKFGEEVKNLKKSISIIKTNLENNIKIDNLRLFLNKHYIYSFY